MWVQANADSLQCLVGTWGVEVARLPSGRGPPLDCRPRPRTSSSARRCPTGSVGCRPAAWFWAVRQATGRGLLAARHARGGARQRPPKTAAYAAAKPAAASTSASFSICPPWPHCRGTSARRRYANGWPRQDESWSGVRRTSGRRRATARPPPTVADRRACPRSPLPAASRPTQLVSARAWRRPTFG